MRHGRHQLECGWCLPPISRDGSSRLRDELGGLHRAAQWYCPVPDIAFLRLLRFRTTLDIVAAVAAKEVDALVVAQAQHQRFLAHRIGREAAPASAASGRL